MYIKTYYLLRNANNFGFHRKRPKCNWVGMSTIRASSRKASTLLFELDTAANIAWAQKRVWTCMIGWFWQPALYLNHHGGHGLTYWVLLNQSRASQCNSSAIDLLPGLRHDRIGSNLTREIFHHSLVARQGSAAVLFGSFRLRTPCKSWTASQTNAPTSSPL
jgi:hypothetical protein